jgi:hypothetical protein
MSAQQSVAYLYLVEEAGRRNEYEKCQSHWLVALLQSCHMVVAHKTLDYIGGNSYKWSLPLGKHVQGVAALGWPCTPVKKEASRLVQPRVDITRRDIRWLRVWGEDDWLATPVTWVSPLSVWRSAVVKPAVPHLAIACVCQAGPKPLLQVAAEASFGPLPKLWLSQLAKRR